MSVFRRRGLVAALLALLAAAPLLAETGHDGWLRYAPLESPARTRYASLPATVVVLGASPVLANGQNELVHGIRGMLDRTLRESRTMPNENAIVLGTIA